MRIYTMTATFGKLEHETLKLEPGLNLIHAPNEWGKSTWCAFLLAMLYGLDTRAKSTRSALADKERYAPWSGSPMSGRMELNWNGRDITIERTTKGRIPLGTFRAYETESGMDVPELNGSNCGQMLLGVEQSVFRRAGFIRLSDLPVTQDDALRARLNALVTTGDESGDAARLEKGLRELRNRVRYNRSGLLPQAEAQREQLSDRLGEIQNLASRQVTLQERIRENEEYRDQLENHIASVRYQEAQRDAARVEEARLEWERASAALTDCRAICAPLPDREEAEEKLQRLRIFRRDQESIQNDLRMLQVPPEMPRLPKPFRGMELTEMTPMAQQDAAAYRDPAGNGLPSLIAAVLCTMLGAILMYLGQKIGYIAAFGAAVAFLALCTARRTAREKRRSVLREKYHSDDPDSWVRMAGESARKVAEYHAAERVYRGGRARLDSRLEKLKKEHVSLCGDASAEQLMANWQKVVNSWDALERAETEENQTRRQYETLQAMSRPADAPASEDSLTLSMEQTEAELRDVQQELTRLRTRLGQYRGRMEALGTEEETIHALAAVNARIRELEKTLLALSLAQKTLAEASQQLQRRFSPRITGRAMALLSRMTDGRYDRLTMAEDFTLRSAAAREDTLHDALWRSDGTVDQLYLALRLSVAEELTPQAPLILDDALVRFDEQRLASALLILREMADCRQVILFTCQKREEEALKALD